jgi:hypothetical protein
MGFTLSLNHYSQPILRLSFRMHMRARISIKAYFVKRNIVQMFSLIVVVQARLLEREEKTEGQQIIVA